MDISDSDSDGFFSDIKALRRQFGLSDTAAPENKRTSNADAEQTRSKNIALADDGNTLSVKQKSKREGAMHALSSAGRSQRIRRAASDSEESDHSLAGSMQLNTVSPEEIAALLSPRIQKEKSGNRQAASRRRRRSGIPPRTPESRIASPQTLLFSHNSSPAMTPTKRHSLAIPHIKRATSSSSITTPVSAEFSMRFLWSKVGDASPLQTPVGQRLVSSPVGSSKRPYFKDSNGLSFSIDAGSTDSDSTHVGLLGSVEEALVTEADIAAAKRKLDEEYALTQQQIIREIRSRIVEFSCPVGSVFHPSDWCESVSILCQFYTLGHGKFAFTNQGLLWRGYVLGPLASVAQAFNKGNTDSSTTSDYEAADTLLVFPWSRVTGLRKKAIDEDCFVMATVDSDLGIAFKMNKLGSDLSDDSIDDMVSKMNSLLTDVLQKESFQRNTRQSRLLQSKTTAEAADLFADQRAAANVNSEYSRLVCCSLELAKRHDRRYQELDVASALGNKIFMDSAASLALEFSLSLATDALASMEKAPTTRSNMGDDDPGTESLPGTCTLCFAKMESVLLQPCEHKVCDGCFSNLCSIYPSSSQKASGECSPDTACICPWDRSGITTWSKI
ncbi:hypothetical protein BX070DRAFT_253867 [Coemansia spiralis]|nr:hypothetical protein BX070DRAFT_253867 [Coemansia spiralis]